MRKLAFVSVAVCIVVVGAGAFAATRDLRLDRPRKPRASMCSAIGDFNRDGKTDRVSIELASNGGMGDCYAKGFGMYDVLAYADADRDRDGARDVGTHSFCIDSRLRDGLQHIECKERAEITYHALRGEDCNDDNVMQSSIADEVYGDGIDNDCNGVIE